MSSHSVMFALLTVSASMPARLAAATWLRISASSGEMITLAPRPRRRSSFAAMKYTADLPQPVRCTTSIRSRRLTSPSIARHWSSRNDVPGPASPCNSSSASARVAGPRAPSVEGDVGWV